MAVYQYWRSTNAFMLHKTPVDSIFPLFKSRKTSIFPHHNFVRKCFLFISFYFYFPYRVDWLLFNLTWFFCVFAVELQWKKSLMEFLCGVWWAEWCNKQIKFTLFLRWKKIKSKSIEIEFSQFHYIIRFFIWGRKFTIDHRENRLIVDFVLGRFVGRFWLRFLGISLHVYWIF